MCCLKGFLNPILTGIVASNIRLRVMITVLHLDAKHQGEGLDDHRSRPDVRGNNDQRHRIKLDYIMGSGYK